ncbi:hypothetical protein KBC55_01290 [Patescibacteria group bacterium]|jgi:hypothetical protein|nr:hypothetical protein [Patescibacteria group bacterium]
MFAIILNLPPAVQDFLNVTPVEDLAAYGFLIAAPFPILGILIWGMVQLWQDFKQDKWTASLKWITLDVKVPRDTVQTPKGMENFFSNLAGVKSGLTWRERWLIGKKQAWFSFELISQGGKISYLIRTQEKYRDIIEADLYAQYPEAQISEVPDYADELPVDYPDEEWDVFGAEILLSKPNYLPIRTYDDFEHQGEKDNRFKDPILPLLEFFGKLRPDERLWIQIMIRPPENSDHVKAGLSFLAKIMGKEEKKAPKGTLAELGDALAGLPKELVTQTIGMDFGGGAAAPMDKKDDFRVFKLTPADKIILDSVAEKIAKVAWEVKIRYVAAGKMGSFRKGHFASGMKGILQPFSSQLLNQLGMHGPSVPNDDYIWLAWQMPGRQKRLVSRFRNRIFDAGATPSIMNSEELATLFHFPAFDARTPSLYGVGARRAEAPEELSFAGPAAPSTPGWSELFSANVLPDDEEAAGEPQEELPAPELPRPHAPTRPGAAPVPTADSADTPPNLPV